MKILRKRRGYTTNSSASNEWLPSMSGSRPVSPQQTQNLISLGIIVGVVAGLFLVEKVVTKILRKRRKDK